MPKSNQKTAFRLTPQYVNIAALGLLFFLTVPGEFFPLRTGLDASYHFALNYLAHSEYLYGADYVFPLGPLGYLLYPLDIGNHLLLAAMVQWCFHAIFIASALKLAARLKEPWPVLFFVPAYLFTLMLTTSEEYQWLATLGLLASVGVIDKAWRRYAFIIVALAAALFCFIKVTLALSALSILFVACIWLRLTKGKTPPSQFVWPWASFAGVTLALALLLLHTPSRIFAWIQYTAVTTAEHSVALSLVGPRSILFMGLFSFVIYALLLMYLARKKSEAFWMMLLFLPALLITFKHGFTRQDGHVLYYFPFLLSVLSFLLLVSLSLNEWRAVLFTFFIVQLLALPVALNYGVPYFADAVDLLSGKRAIDNLGNLLRLPATRERLAEESHENLRARRLPDPWLERIRGDGGTVDVFPWELNYIPANGLTWQPSPLLQGYLILTQSLDQRTAGHLSGSYAPDFLLVHFEDIDGRNLILDAPATWRAIRANYDILDRREKLFLLQKAGSGPQMTEFTPVASLAVEGSKWLDVPAVNAEPYLFMDMRLSWLGQLRKSLFRIPAVMIECNYRNDLPQSFRITPNTAANGLALGATPRTADEFALWFEGSLKNEVTHFRFYEAGGFQHYRSPISAQWRILE